MRKNKWKNVLLLFGVFLVLLVSLWLPGQLFMWQDKKTIGKVETAPMEEVILSAQETTTMLEKAKLFSGLYGMNGEIQVAHLDRVLLSDIEELHLGRAVRKAYDTLCESEVIKPMELSENFWADIEQNKFGFLVFDMNRPGNSIVVWAYLLYDDEGTTVINMEQESGKAIGVAQWTKDWENHPEKTFHPKEDAVKAYMEYLGLAVREFIPAGTAELTEEVYQKQQENYLYGSLPRQVQAYTVSITDGRDSVSYLWEMHQAGFRLGESTVYD